MAHFPFSLAHFTLSCYYFPQVATQDNCVFDMCAKALECEILAGKCSLLPGLALMGKLRPNDIIYFFFFS